MSDDRAVVAGLDVSVTGAWLAATCGLRPPVTVAPVVGGRSNLTAVVTDAEGRSVVVRRPPLAGVLASAHDVVREGRIVAALAGTAVPVPPVLAVTDGTDPSGPDVPLLVTDLVDGTVVRDRTVASGVDPAIRAAVTVPVAGTLAALHAVDVVAVGLGDLSRRGGYLRRQVDRWTRQLAKGSDRPLPTLERLARVLAGIAPEQEEVALVHGDYRLDNLIVAPEGTAVRAVLDWELATLGDPLADLGTLLAYWGVPATADAPASSVHPDLPTVLEGFASPAALVDAYAAASGGDPDALAERLRPYLAFAWFRIACIVEGVRVRTAAGAYGDAAGSDADPAREAELALFADLVPRLADRALAVASRTGPVGFDHELT